MKTTLRIACFAIVCCAVAPAFGDGLLPGFQKGDVTLDSIGPINFGPDGILFVSDPKASTIYAIDNDDRAEAPANREDVVGLDGKIASLLGSAVSDILIQDMAINPISGNIYLSVSRGRGPDAQPVLMRVTTVGDIEALSLKNIAFSKASLWATPDKDRRGRDIRQDAITEIAYIDGTVVVAGLSNQEFSSRLRAIPFPFTGEDWETGLEIYHTSHGKWETHSPIRSFTPFIVDDEPFILAAHTCTPLVRFPVSDIRSSDNKLVGSTIAELGNMNRPLDMLVYTKEQQDYLLITNSRRGAMKLAMAPMDDQEALTDRIPGTAGADIITIDSLSGALQVEAWGTDEAIVLIKTDSGAIDLTTVPLP